ncbi:M12 family metallo-peptidase [Longirhabdus pacifica]|uniref:M12 family metallo-peptidase n=1 Tax=Longirhabdus pacifica TaxID=2305227 RepID=UPI0013E8AD25|nr:M12 family metallo-peptidase [Longirhabdus pacifica]
MKKIFSVISVVALTFSLGTVYTEGKGGISTLEAAPEVTSNHESSKNHKSDEYHLHSVELSNAAMNGSAANRSTTRRLDHNHEPSNAPGIRVTVKVAADEEFREKYGWYWKGYTYQVVERMDDVLYRDFNINFTVDSRAEWETDGKTASEITHELKDEMRDSNYDFVIGFTKDPNYSGGIGGQAIPKVGLNTVFDQYPDATWRALLHEVGHNYGLGHHDSHDETDCIMGHNMYSVDFFCDYHAQQLKENIHLHGTPQ